MPELLRTPISGLLEIFPKLFPDSSGYFFESFRQDWQVAEGIISERDEQCPCLGEFYQQSGGGL
ncbi:dTDP-4-dehydrorhamnose 3,5-epimerase family protein [Algoriphagus sp. H41]|uniref:dTDP-4-dehydrorhamnose 3,5-epimerase family protein n=1 Tax=Algoriphagus oliviformis TaxID=2811231 RepID=A0ABS3BZQ8_9BACT|nr:dTDP-4-dehydrorhamnose 3,5-epimerase family protein [Algoriphagus oliviformis]MBN7809879.1 dTDP-4-dehydrorhamnose 3,5-epimerase family protein [Algoriphagus oliviformis]